MSSHLIEQLSTCGMRPRLPSYYDTKQHISSFLPPHQNHQDVGTKTQDKEIKHRGVFLPGYCHSRWFVTGLQVLASTLSAIGFVIHADQTAKDVCEKFSW
jgi:hypothetical protein